MTRTSFFCLVAALAATTACTAITGFDQFLVRDGGEADGDSDGDSDGDPDEDLVGRFEVRLFVDDCVEGGELPPFCACDPPEGPFHNCSGDPDWDRFLPVPVARSLGAFVTIPERTDVRDVGATVECGGVELAFAGFERLREGFWQVLDLTELEPSRCELAVLATADNGDSGEARVPLRVDNRCDEDRDGHPIVRCGGWDCDDSDDGIYPGAPEICGNEVDENCDGVANRPLGEPLREAELLLGPTGTPRWPDLAPAGPLMVLGWHEDGGVFASAVDAAGVLAPPEGPMGPAPSEEVVVAAGRESVAAAWTVPGALTSEVQVLVMDQSGGIGTTVGERAAESPALAWAGESFHVAWREGTGIMLAPVVDPTAPIRLGTSGLTSPEVAIVACGDRVVVAWIGPASTGGSQTIWLARLDDGRVQAFEVEPSVRPPGPPALACSGEVVTVAWAQPVGAADAALTVARLEAGGVGTPLRLVPSGLADGERVAIGSGPGGLLLAWVEGALATRTVHVGVLPDASPILQRRLSMSSDQARGPVLAVSESFAGLAWHASATRSPAIFFRALGSCVP